MPLNKKETMIDIAAELDLEVLLVAGNRLGAINHTLLAVEALKRRNMKIAGIIFNRTVKGGYEAILRDNIDIIGKISGEKVLGELPYSDDTEALYEAMRGMASCLVTRDSHCHSERSD